jgi:adenylate kinase
MAEIVVVTGTPGSGKTTIVKSFKGLNCTVLGVGEMMEKVAVEKRYVKNKDELRYLTNERLTELRTLTFKEIAAMKGRVIVDTHASVVKKNRFFPGLPFYAVELLKGLKGFVYIDATAEEIIARRLKDKTRKREVQHASEIDDQRTINISNLSYYASMLNIPLYIIGNREGQLQKAETEFAESIEEMFGEKK